MVKMSIKELSMDISEEEQRELDAVESRQPVFDEDCPEMTAEKLMQFRLMSSDDRNKRECLKLCVNLKSGKNDNPSPAQ